MVRPRQSFPKPRCHLSPPMMARPCVAGRGILQRTTQEGRAVLAPPPRDFLNCHLEFLMSERDRCGRLMAWMKDCPASSLLIRLQAWPRRETPRGTSRKAIPPLCRLLLLLLPRCRCRYRCRMLTLLPLVTRPLATWPRAHLARLL